MPLFDKMMDDIRDIPHGFKLSFSIIIMGLILNGDEIPLLKFVWVDMGVIMGLLPGLRCFDNLENSAMVLIGFFKHK